MDGELRSDKPLASHMKRHIDRAINRSKVQCSQYVAHIEQYTSVLGVLCLYCLLNYPCATKLCMVSVSIQDLGSVIDLLYLSMGIRSSGLVLVEGFNSENPITPVLCDLLTMSENLAVKAEESLGHDPRMWPSNILFWGI